MSKRAPAANDGPASDDRLREQRADDEPDQTSSSADGEREVIWLGRPDPSDPERLRVQILGSAHGPSILDFVSAYKSPGSSD